MLGLDAAPAPRGMLICYAVLPLRVFVCRSRPSGRAFRAEIVCTVNMFIANAINGNDDKAGGGAAGLVQISHLNRYTKLMFVRLCECCVSKAFTQNVIYHACTSVVCTTCFGRTIIRLAPYNSMETLHLCHPSNAAEFLRARFAPLHTNIVVTYSRPIPPTRTHAHNIQYVILFRSYRIDFHTAHTHTRVHYNGGRIVINSCA